MSDILVSLEALGKRYVLRHAAVTPYRSLREELSGAIRRVPRWLSGQRGGRDTREEFWALRDVSFDVRRGQVLGIVGRNGAGKSTLLKILSRITEPTEGRARLRGRVASLLEVGTGFHPELTGRENIFLNGVILGMTRAEIRKRLDQIVAFAEVARFLDTPVKRYSSGMYVRLAFSVAAHLDSEILIVDEVLSVGDADFQRKCLGRMGQMTSDEGRTVLFVSHNMVAVGGLSDSVLWLANGRVAGLGAPDETIRKYLASTVVESGAALRRHTGSEVRIEGVELRVDGMPANNVQSGQPCELRLRLRYLDPKAAAAASVSIMLFSQGQKLANLWSNCQPGRLPAIRTPDEGSIVVVCRIPRWPFRDATIRVDVFTHMGPVTQDWVEEALTFESRDGDYFSSGVVPNPDQGILFLDHDWTYHADE